VEAGYAQCVEAEQKQCLAAVIRKTKRNAAGSGEEVLQPCYSVSTPLSKHMPY